MSDFKIKYHLNNLLLFTLCLFFTSTITAMQITNKEMDKFLQTPEKIASPDTVFKLRAMIYKNQITFAWDIKENCYLYLDKFSFTTKNNIPYNSPSFPKGKLLSDEYFGKVEVFFDFVETSLSLVDPLPTEIIVTYQGCNQTGYCYTPIKKNIKIDKDLGIVVN